tara:strand:+ start:55423 stop:56358 length:936 start_codon:yes stop_codon:yes gene_type:complete
MNLQPQISIIMATYNRAHFIEETLLSIKNQTYTHWVCLIIDDGGTDNTKNVIKPLLLEDSRFQYHKRPVTYKKGLPGSRNYGLDLAKGDYIIFFDDDDIIHPQNLNYCIEALQKVQVDFCHYQKQSFENNLPEIESDKLEVNRRLSINDIEVIVTGAYALASCTVLWKKDCFHNIRFNETLMYAEEWECYTNIILHGFKGISLKNTLYYNRKHSVSNTGQFWKKNPIHIASKKKALVLVAKNLEKKNYLTISIQKYILGLAISYRDLKLLKNLLEIINRSKLFKTTMLVKYYLFSLWRILYKIKIALLNNN